jgi:hypothetical protein
MMNLVRADAVASVAAAVIKHSPQTNNPQKEKEQNQN